VDVERRCSKVPHAMQPMPYHAIATQVALDSRTLTAVSVIFLFLSSNQRVVESSSKEHNQPTCICSRSVLITAVALVVWNHSCEHCGCSDLSVWCGDTLLTVDDLGWSLQQPTHPTHVIQCRKCRRGVSVWAAPPCRSARRWLVTVPSRCILGASNRQHRLCRWLVAHDQEKVPR
jgi:hypothetical protein